MKLPSLDPSTLSQLLGVVSDVTLVMDLHGVIEDVSTRRSILTTLGCQAWVSRRWIDTVTTESHIKIQEMLQSQGVGGALRWQHVTHMSPLGKEVALQYVVLPLGVQKLLAMGRELEIQANPFADLAQLVGRRPLKDIVGETVDTIERTCIEVALELTHNNRASAAEVLGLSRQSLYVKLRRFGIGTQARANNP